MPCLVHRCLSGFIAASCLLPPGNDQPPRSPVLHEQALFAPVPDASLAQVRWDLVIHDIPQLAGATRTHDQAIVHANVQQAAAAARPTPVEQEEVPSNCLHGSTILEQQERVAAVHGYLERHDKQFLEFKAKYQGQEFNEHQREISGAKMKDLGQFWSEPKHARLIDANMVRFCFAYATETALNGSMEISRRIAYLGIYLATWFKLGKDTFPNALVGIPVAISDPQSLSDFQASLGKIDTERGLVLFLSKQIPCTCLDEDKKNAKQAPKTGRCGYCCREDLKAKLRKCSQCKTLPYCSKECQVADWRAGHKKECEMWKLKATLKAQTRR
jgi:hypothetical protein